MTETIAREAVTHAKLVWAAAGTAAAFFERIDRAGLTDRGAFFVLFVGTDTSSELRASAPAEQMQYRAPAIFACCNLLSPQTFVKQVDATCRAAQDGTPICVIARRMLSGVSDRRLGRTGAVVSSTSLANGGS